MTNRKKKILIGQIFLFICAVSIVFLIFNQQNQVSENSSKEKILKDEKIVEQSTKNKFEKITYSGVDINGNRYTLTSDIAEFDISKPEIIFMEIMKATFYFKDDTILYVNSLKGVYNNKTNDMYFKKNVTAKYEESVIYSNNLDYNNTKNLLTAYGDVKGNNLEGDIEADKLNFDLSKKTLDISMFNNKQINVNLKN